MRPVLDERKCPAKGQICPVIPACPESAVSFVADKSTRLGGRIIFNLEKCNACSLCVPACCGNAIELDES